MPNAMEVPVLNGKEVEDGFDSIEDSLEALSMCFFYCLSFC